MYWENGLSGLRYPKLYTGITPGSNKSKPFLSQSWLFYQLYSLISGWDVPRSLSPFYHGMVFRDTSAVCDAVATLCPINVSTQRNYNCFQNALDQNARSKSIMCSGYGWTNFLKQHMFLTSQNRESQREDTLWLKSQLSKDEVILYL